MKAKQSPTPEVNGGESLMSTALGLHKDLQTHKTKCFGILEGNRGDFTVL